MKRLLRAAALFVALVLLATFSGCGAGAPAEPVIVEKEVIKEIPKEVVVEKPVVVEKEVIKEIPKEVVVEKPVIVEKEVVKEVEAAASEGGISSADEYSQSNADLASRINTSVATQNRIIVHTANALLVVDDVAQAIAQVDELALEFGGWVVGSDRSSRHSGYIAIRVPAATLNQVIKRLEQIAIDVESMALSSQDVTDEYVDTQSRLTSLRATEQALLKLLDRAQNVEHALRVQQEVAQIQLRIEEMQGRIKFLEQTSAFSLVNVNLKLSTVDMPVDAGGDSAFKVGQSARFRATFMPPPGIDDFTFTWDFGDGATASGSGTTWTTNVGERVTGSVNHVYEEEGDYVVEVTINGSGDAGLAEGSGSLVASVTRVPGIEVFAGERQVVEEREEVEYTASFTRPDELWDYEFRWDFGDGTPTVIGTPEEGITRVSAFHTFADHRPFPYEVKFTVTAMSEAGKVSGFGPTNVHVTESEGYIIGGWDPGETGKSAIRALSVVVMGVATVIIWLGVFLPVWVGIAVVVILLIALRRRFSGGSFPLPGFHRSRPVAPKSAVPENTVIGPASDVTGAETEGTPNPRE